jgi:hypothetical protein
MVQAPRGSHPSPRDVDCEIDLSTRNGNARLFINSRYLNVIKSGAYQRDRYQQRPLINMVNSW